MHAPAQQFVQPAPSSNSYPSPSAYSADLAAQLDLLSGDSFNAGPTSGPAARSQPQAVPSWEAGSMTSNSPWSRPQMEAGVSQEAMERHAMLPMAPSSARLSRRESQVYNAPLFGWACVWAPAAFFKCVEAHAHTLFILLRPPTHEHSMLDQMPGCSVRLLGRRLGVGRCFFAASGILQLLARSLALLIHAGDAHPPLCSIFRSWTLQKMQRREMKPSNCHQRD